MGPFRAILAFARDWSIPRDTSSKSHDLLAKTHALIPKSSESFTNTADFPLRMRPKAGKRESCKFGSQARVFAQKS
jgi:hypothetical protein